MLFRFFVLLGRYGIYVLIFLVVWNVAFYLFRYNFLAAARPGSQEVAYFEVRPGQTLKGIAQDLEKRNLLNNWYSLVFLSKLRSTGDKIKAGEYELSPGYSPGKMYEVLTSGKVVVHELTIPEGTSVKELPKLMAATTLVSEAEAFAALSDSALMRELGIPSLTPEGYIFPETYHFSRPVTASQMIKRIVEEGRQKIETKIPDWDGAARRLGFSEYQILILASIIEKESGKPDERKLISSVFHNRLRIMMPLQSDPTVIYGLPKFDGNLTKEHLKTAGPYNTYLNPGLPPTPICNPGIESIKAALFPDDTDFLYFVSKGDGSHHFSKTYKEHLQAVENYQRR